MSEFKKRDCPPFTHTDELCTGRCSRCDNYKLYNYWVQIETMETIKRKMRDEHLFKGSGHYRHDNKKNAEFG